MPKKKPTTESPGADLCTCGASTAARPSSHLPGCPGGRQMVDDPDKAVTVDDRGEMAEEES